MSEASRVDRHIDFFHSVGTGDGGVVATVSVSVSAHEHDFGAEESDFCVVADGDGCGCHCDRDLSCDSHSGYDCGCGDHDARILSQHCHSVCRYLCVYSHQHLSLHPSALSSPQALMSMPSSLCLPRHGPHHQLASSSLWMHHHHRQHWYDHWPHCQHVCVNRCVSLHVWSGVSVSGSGSGSGSVTWGRIWMWMSGVEVGSVNENENGCHVDAF